MLHLLFHMSLPLSREFIIFLLGQLILSLRYLTR